MQHNGPGEAGTEAVAGAPKLQTRPYKVLTWLCRDRSSNGGQAPPPSTPVAAEQPPSHLSTAAHGDSAAIRFALLAAAFCAWHRLSRSRWYGSLPEFAGHWLGRSSAYPTAWTGYGLQHLCLSMQPQAQSTPLAPPARDSMISWSVANLELGPWQIELLTVLSHLTI